jgi:hypothetical protein
MAELNKNNIKNKASEDLDPINVSMEKHFFDQAKERGIPENEIIDFFDKLGEKKNVFLDFLKKYFEIVVKDKKSNIHIPFMADTRTKIKGVTAKTIIKKPNFTTTNKIMTISEKIQKRGDNWVVLSSSGDEVLGTHDTKDKALKQLAAIEISKAKRAKMKEAFEKVIYEADKSDRVKIVNKLLEFVTRKI